MVLERTEIFEMLVMSVVLMAALVVVVPLVAVAVVVMALAAAAMVVAEVMVLVMVLVMVGDNGGGYVYDCCWVDGDFLTGCGGIIDAARGVCDGG